MKYHPAALTLLISAVLVTLQSPPALGQEPNVEVVRVSTDLVTVPVIVKTRAGGYVPNLQVEDFRVYEDGVEQQISYFETIDKPFTVVLMLDISDSIELQDIQNAAIAFLKQLRPDDRSLVVAFDKQVVRLTPITGDPRLLSEAINKAKARGGTALYDAIDTVISSYLKAVSGRKAIVLLTDGIDTSSVRTTYDSTAALANEQYALIYPIQWNTPDNLLARQLARGDNTAVLGVTYTTPKGESLRQAYTRGTEYLRLLARTSGGRFQQAEKLKSLERSFAQIAEELRQQYELGYYPRNRAATRRKRRIRITVRVPDTIVHARSSYSYNPQTR
jgi:VWFA-related protein